MLARELSNVEIKILQSILVRKFNLSLDAATLYDTTVHQKLISKLLEMGSQKRPEENYKFIFKKTLKIMKENFRDISKKKRIRK